MNEGKVALNKEEVAYNEARLMPIKGKAGSDEEKGRTGEGKVISNEEKVSPADHRSGLYKARVGLIKPCVMLVKGIHHDIPRRHF